jgi:hypothetical protein
MNLPPPVDTLRVAVGTPDEPFAPPWRFWTHGDSAYLAVRLIGAIFKASFHPPDERHESAVWNHGFTTESGGMVEERGSRLSHTWQLPDEFAPGWYQGPAISVPRLADRNYDLPPNAGLEDVDWVAAPAPGNARFLTVYLNDGRADLPSLVLGEGEMVVAVLRMRNGWNMVVLSGERPFHAHELPPLQRLLDETRIGLRVEPRRGVESASIVWVTTSPAGPPMFVVVVLGSNNWYLEPDQPE